jgi:hypothetical protein
MAVAGGFGDPEVELKVRFRGITAATLGFLEFV